MRKIAALLAALGAIAALAVAGTGTAAPGPGCPTGGDPNNWFAVSIFATLPDGIDVGNFHDQNGDTIVCAKVNAGQTAKNGGFPSWTVKDNS